VARSQDNPRAEQIERAIIGSCPALRGAIAATRRIGPRKVSVLVRGETGTGKERMAQLVHERSGRSGRLVAVNCASFAETMLEAELFGHERGAFTGAQALKRGLFESADGGTLFLDEVGEVALALEAKLLRVLQEGRIRRVGGTREIPVDVRVVSATHQDLQALVEDGRFRQDLYFRLAGYRIELPPLRERGRDTVRIARHLLREDPELLGEKPWRLCRDAEDEFLRHGWPGNVRELRNVLMQLVVDVRGARVQRRHVRDALGDRTSRHDEERIDLDEATVTFVRERIAASSVEIRAELGLSKSAAQRRLHRLCLSGRLERVGVGVSCRYRVVAGPRPCADPRGRERIALTLAREEGRVSRQSLSAATGSPSGRRVGC